MNDVVRERRGRYALAVRRALDWLAAQQGEDSSFGVPVSEGVTSIFVTPLTFLWGRLPGGRRKREKPGPTCGERARGRESALGESCDMLRRGDFRLTSAQGIIDK